MGNVSVKLQGSCNRADIDVHVIVSNQIEFYSIIFFVHI